MTTLKPKPSDSKPMTPASCALGCGLWLIVMALPAAAFLFAVQGELKWARGPADLVEDRLFLVNEARASGLGYVASRVTRDDSGAGGPLCVQTQVAYWLWRNEEADDPNVRYCQCYTRRSDGQYQLNGDACPGNE
jgi:hypothetical protein